MSRQPLGTLIRRTLDIRVSVEVPAHMGAPDDCDAATLVGIIREALESSVRLRQAFGGQLVTLSGPNPVFGDATHSTAFRAGTDDESQGDAQ